MGLSSFPPAVGTRLITKADTAGQTVLPSTTTSTAATTSSSNSTFGSWTQVVASTSAEYILTGVVASFSSNAATGPILVDIGTGGSGSETVVASTAIGGTTTIGGSTVNGLAGTHNFAVPLRISSGTRLAVRVAVPDAQSSARTMQVRLLVTPYANVEGN